MGQANCVKGIDNYWIVEENDRINFAYIDEDDSSLNGAIEAMDKIKKTSSKTLKYSYVHDKVLFTIHHKEINKIPDIINTLLGSGCNLHMNDCSEHKIRSSDILGYKYNWTTREKVYYKKWFGYRKEHPMVWKIIKGSLSAMWRLEGRVQLPELKKFLLEEFPEENKRECFVECKSGYYCIVDRNDARLNQPNESVDEKYSSDYCLVCHDAKPSTVVKPCGHKIVCAKCSDELHKIPSFERKCIMCQQQIKTIVYDNGKVFNFD